MTYHDDEDIYKKRGKTRQSLKVRDKKKKVAKDYVLEGRPSRNYSTKFTEENAYENALGPKTKSKVYRGKTSKPVIDKPKNVKQAIPKRQRSESPPPKHLRSKNGRNKGKADCCSYCRPEISKRIYDAFSTKMTIKSEVDQYLQEQERLDKEALIDEASLYENYNDKLMLCKCKESEREGYKEDDDEGHGTESPGQEESSPGAQDYQDNEIDENSDVSESDSDEEYEDYHKISRSDEGIKEIEGVGEGWELVDG